MTREEMEEWLVQKAENQARLLKEVAKWEDPEQGKTQTSKAIEVARAAITPRLFINWLRYQAARESPRDQFWSITLKGKTLAEAIAADLNEIKREVRPEDLMDTVSLYLGYFRRALVGIKYLDKISDP